MALTEKQDRLVDLVKSIDPDMGWGVGMCLAASVYGFEQEAIDYIEMHPGIGTNDFSDWVASMCPEE